MNAFNGELWQMKFFWWLPSINPPVHLELLFICLYKSSVIHYRVISFWTLYQLWPHLSWRSLALAQQLLVYSVSAKAATTSLSQTGCVLKDIYCRCVYYLAPRAHMCPVKKRDRDEAFGAKKGGAGDVWGKKKMNVVNIALICRGAALPSGLMSVLGWLVGSQAWLNVVPRWPRGGWPDLKLLPVPLCHPNGSLWSNVIYLYTPTHTRTHTHIPLVSSMPFIPLWMLFFLLGCHLSLTSASCHKYSSIPNEISFHNHAGCYYSEVVLLIHNEAEAEGWWFGTTGSRNWMRW